MNPEFPLWLTVVASALGGAGVTGLVTLGLKLADFRHRHDDVKRDHYLALVEAFDVLYQAVLDAVDARNEYAARVVRNGKRAEELRVEAFDRARATDDPHATVRRSFQLVGLFAPPSVLAAVQEMYNGVSEPFIRVHDPLPTSDEYPEPIPWLGWPEDASTRLRLAIRSDLGVVGTPVRHRLLQGLRDRLRRGQHAQPVWRRRAPRLDDQA